MIYEDELPEDITDEEYALWFERSMVDGVRVGPSIEFVRSLIAAQQKRGTDALPCGHNQGIAFGENSWTCAVCGQPAHSSR